MITKILPKLITFDGEARSGKGTIVGAVKDHLRDELNHKVMLIDAGQVFRSLVVMATRSGVDVNDPAAIDAYLSNKESVVTCVQFVKDVYQMQKAERDALLYSNEVSLNSGKFGARPLCQAFKDNLLKKWLRDADTEGYEIVLLDGRALEEVGAMLEDLGLCDFAIGLYFVCDPQVGARRTLGYYATPYDQLDDDKRDEVDSLVKEIKARNDSDQNRDVHPVLPPADAITIRLPRITNVNSVSDRTMVIVDTSADMTKHEMVEPVSKVVSSLLNS